MLDVLKTLIDGILEKAKTFKGDWNENDSTSPNYIKNKPFWSNITEHVLVDNLTSADYNDGINVPLCNFIIGNTYKVIWNGKVYDNLICHEIDGYNVIASTQNNCPFYIDDDGGNDLYIDAEEEYTVSIIEKKETVHKLDEKYLPNDIARIGDIPTELPANGGYADIADIAISASKDSAGNTITAWYETKNDAFTKLNTAKEYTNSKISEWVGDQTVSTQISNAISTIEIPQPDWSETDSASVNYIQNRTHYDDNKIITMFDSDSGKSDPSFLNATATEVNLKYCPT
jgi:hypothetical protein